MKKKLLTSIRRIVGYERIKRLEPQIQELRYAQLFHDSIIDSEWYKYKTLSLGEMAIDYGTAYVIFRTLEIMRPSSVLEFGLGQSSKLLHQYADFYHCECITYEHDINWINCFIATIGGKYHVNTEMLELEKKQYEGKETLTYKNVCAKLKDKKYEFVFVDGPFGDDEMGHHYQYSRTEIIDVIENNLAESFCIIMHDYERTGEQNTIAKVLEKLDNKRVGYCTKIYSAQKQCFLICSDNLKFLTSL